MRYVFPPGSFATVVEAYVGPYPDPIVLKTGDPVVPDLQKTQQTDLRGWTWCRGPDGREGWVPTTWLETGEPWRSRCDYTAVELTVAAGDRLLLLHSESGFIFAQAADGAQGWVPDAVLRWEGP